VRTKTPKEQATSRPKEAKKNRLTLGDQDHREDGSARLSYAGIGREASQHAVPLEEREQAQRPGYSAAD